MEAAQGPQHPDLSYPLLPLAYLLRQTERPVEAEALLRRAEAVVRGALHPGDWRLLQTQLQLADLLIELGRFEEAESLLKTAQRELEHPEADRERGQAELRRQFVVLYEAWDRPAEADAYRSGGPQEPG